MNKIITKIGTYTYYWSNKNFPSGTSGWFLQVSDNKYFSNLIFNGTVNINVGSRNIVFNKEAQYYFRFKKGTMITPFDSVIYRANAEGEVVLNTNNWMMLTKGSEVSENYTFEVEPAAWDINQQHLYRTFQRNLRGDLLYSIQTSKDKIILDFSQQQYIGDYAKSILEYYFYRTQSFYLAKRFEDQVFGVYQRVWEVVFEDEEINLERMGVTLSFVEV